MLWTKNKEKLEPGAITCGHPTCDNHSHTVQLDLNDRVKLSEEWRKRPLGCRLAQHGHYRKFRMEDPGDNDRARDVKLCLSCGMRWWSF